MPVLLRPRRGYRSVAAAALAAVAAAGAVLVTPPEPALSAAAAARSPSAANHCHRSAIEVPSCGVLWGQFRPKTAHGSVWSADYGALEQRMGRRFDIVKDYVGWQRGVLFPSPGDARAATGGRTLYISWNAVDYRTRAPVRYASIAHGKWDRRVLRPQARRLRHYHHKVFLDFNHEFDAKDQSGKGGPREFAAAYRHIHRYFERHGVHNVIWVWVSTGWIGNAHKIRAGYPGRHYVDWVGYDPYNMAACAGWRWQSSYQAFSPFYRWVSHQRGMRHKPMLLSEYGTVAGPRVRHWYASIPATLQRLPRLKALIQFSAPTTMHCDVDVTHSASALAGFVAAATSRSVLG